MKATKRILSETAKNVRTTENGKKRKCRHTHTKNKSEINRGSEIRSGTVRRQEQLNCVYLKNSKFLCWTVIDLTER